MMQWVHRSTRGCSYGSSITDPRTGEILKGHVTLGSLRVRQDYLIAEALLAPYDGNQKVSVAGVEMALAGITFAIPVDEVIDVMGEIGREMDVRYREAAGGGLAVTPTGRRLAKERVSQSKRT